MTRGTGKVMERLRTHRWGILLIISVVVVIPVATTVVLWGAGLLDVQPPGGPVRTQLGVPLPSALAIIGVSLSSSVALVGFSPEAVDR